MNVVLAFKTVDLGLVKDLTKKIVSLICCVMITAYLVLDLSITSVYNVNMVEI